MKIHEQHPTRYGKKWKIKKHDRVLVISGQYRGTVGTVTDVDREKDRVALSELPAVVRHVKPNDLLAPEGKIKRKRYIHVSNVSLFVEQDGKNVASKVKIDKTDGKRVRVLKKTNESIDEEKRYG